MASIGISHRRGVGRALRLCALAGIAGAVAGCGSLPAAATPAVVVSSTAAAIAAPTDLPTLLPTTAPTLAPTAPPRPRISPTAPAATAVQIAPTTQPTAEPTERPSPTPATLSLEERRQIFEEIVAVASGKQSKSELSGVGEEEFAPWIIGPVL